MTPALLNFTLYRGSDFDPIVITVRDEDTENPIDLTNWGVIGKTRDTNGTVIDLVPTITDPPNGQVTIGFSGAETLGFDVGRHPWDLVFIQPDGSPLGPYVAGDITVKDVVSHL
jgi:hypothetical protein